MKNTHTKILFCVKDEPLLSLLQKTFAGLDYSLKALSDKEFLTIQLNIAKELTPLDNEIILIDGQKIKYEAFKNYTPKIK